MSKIPTLALLFLFLLAVSIKGLICHVSASRPVYISADGSVKGTDKIQRMGNIYIFIGDIQAPLFIERDDIVIDGAGYALKGDGNDAGITLTSRNNVTIRNMEIENFKIGIQLKGASNNTICDNHIENNRDGILITDLWPLADPGIGSSRNTITRNIVANNKGCGIKITRWSGCNRVAENNIVFNREDGVYVDTFSCQNSIINNSIVSNGRYGIHLDYYSDSNIVADNHIAQNGWIGLDTSKPPFLIWCGGIRIYRSINNTLRNNRMVDNSYNFDLVYIFVSQAINDIDASNIVNGKPIYHWIGEKDRVVPEDAGYVALINCVNITVRNLKLSNNKDGILLMSTVNSTITGNNITNCIIGIFLDHSSAGMEGTTIGSPSSGIIIHGNNISSNEYGIYFGNAYENIVVGNNVYNNKIGIRFDEGEKNKIYHNNFINNIVHVEFNGFWMPPFAPARINIWDDGYPSGGNFWSDYKEKYPNATVLKDLGIWGTAYAIAQENQDNYPLVNPIENVEPLDLTIIYEQREQTTEEESSQPSEPSHQLPSPSQVTSGQTTTEQQPTPITTVLILVIAGAITTATVMLIRRKRRQIQAQVSTCTPSTMGQKYIWDKC